GPPTQQAPARGPAARVWPRHRGAEGGRPLAGAQHPRRLCRQGLPLPRLRPGDPRRDAARGRLARRAVLVGEQWRGGATALAHQLLAAPPV
ncbi:MAG: ATP/GTP-binding protein, partial [uncultured Friedmanniella sp.]